MLFAGHRMEVGFFFYVLEHVRIFHNLSRHTRLNSIALQERTKPIVNKSFLFLNYCENKFMFSSQAYINVFDWCSVQSQDVQYHKLYL